MLSFMCNTTNKIYSEYKFATFSIWMKDWLNS